jgi:hypothetical protein
MMVDDGQFHILYDLYRSSNSWKKLPFPNSKLPASPFLERVRSTKQAIRVTRFGKPIAQILPPADAKKPHRRLGTLGGGRIIGDESDWDAAGPPGKNEMDK